MPEIVVNPPLYDCMRCEDTGIDQSEYVVIDEGFYMLTGCACKCPLGQKLIEEYDEEAEN